MTTIGRMRKFFYGDMVVLKSKAHYPRHVGHKGIISGARIGRGPTSLKSTVNYKVECSCGARLFPKGDHMDFISEPIVDVVERPVHELRMEHFLGLIGATIKNKPLQKQVDVALSSLKERDKYLLVRRFGLDGKEAKLLREIGDDLGITKARSQQLEQSLLEKLRR